MLDILKAKARGDWEAVNEASLGRVWKHTQKAGKVGFSILTSWLDAKTPKENRADFRKLQSEVRSLGLGFFKLIGHWAECQDPDIAYADCPKDRLVDVVEPSLFVPGMSLKDAKRLGAKYGQNMVVYAGPETKGKVAFVDGKSGALSVAGEFSPNKIARGYSRVKGRPFVFEYVAQSWFDVMAERQFDPNLGRLIDELDVAVDDL